MPAPTITWQKDVDAALAQAARDNKPLLVDFTAAPA
jgi:Thioredoxin-like